MIKILKYGETSEEEIFARAISQYDVEGTVSEIIEKVRAEGDKALFEYNRKFDGADLEELTVSEAEMEEAMEKVDGKLIKILEKARDNIEAFHKMQKREGFRIKKEDGTVLGQKIIPVERAGLYVPGGTAAYPSTVLMDSIPAKIAGVKSVVMTTPPSKDGKVNPVILAAARVAGVDTIYKVGGAQAIAALAYGTETIKSVDKIVGPGNAFVAEAKKQVFGKVSIDMVAGPSEILIISDSGSNPANVAADLLSQAEHDRLACAVLITDSEAFAEKVRDEVDRQLRKLDRYEIADASIENNGKIIVVENLDLAIEVSNRIAPEHLELCLDDPFEALERITNAGSVFLGRNTPEAIGDYIAGPNHTLPTSGSARFSSPLSVDDFIKKTQYIYYSEEAIKKDGRDVEYFALCEGLEAHAKSVVSRLEE